jgi:hypothetical protein
MSIGGRRLGFDITDADTILASDNVGAWLRAGSDGDRISSTNVGGKEGLDVNIINPLTVNIDGIYDGVNNTDPDNIGAIFHVRAASPADADQTKRTTGAAASVDAIVAANFHGQDVNSALLGFNGTTWDRIRSWKSTGVIRAVDVKTGFLVTAETVGLTASELVSSPLANRTNIRIQNLGNRDMWIGTSNAVTAANGYLIPAKGEESFDYSEDVDVWAIGDAAGLDVRVIEEAS